MDIQAKFLTTAIPESMTRSPFRSDLLPYYIHGGSISCTVQSTGKSQYHGLNWAQLAHIRAKHLDKSPNYLNNI